MCCGIKKEVRTKASLPDGAFLSVRSTVTVGYDAKGLITAIFAFSPSAIADGANLRYNEVQSELTAVKRSQKAEYRRRLRPVKK